MDSQQLKSKDSAADSSDKHTIGLVKDVTSPPDFRNILKRFEETKDIVKVEKAPSATDVLPPTVSPCRIGKASVSEDKKVDTSAQDVAGAGNVAEENTKDKTKSTSVVSSDVKDVCVDTREKEITPDIKVDSSEENVGKLVTSKSISASESACSGNTGVKTSETTLISSTVSDTKSVTDNFEPRAKVMLVGKNVSSHPLSVIKDEEIATSEELLIDLGTEEIKKTESVTATSDPSNSSENQAKRKYSLEELEHSFISALNMPVDSTSNVNVQNIAKLVSKSVPAIEITDVSEFEEEKKSPDTEDEKATVIVSDTENVEAYGDGNVQSSSETAIEDSSYEAQSSIAQSLSLEFVEDEVVVTEAPKKDEAKPIFYISSTELPPQLRQRATMMPGESYLSQEPNNRVSQSCLCSKDLHGMIFLIGSSVALLAFCVAALAHQGAIPDYYEVIGFSVSIISGIFGLLSFLCYTILTCYSACTAHGYQRLSDAESALPFNRGAPYENFVEESWSSEKERAWRRQNAMSSTRTSEISVGSVSERQELINKTEKIKKDVTELLDTFANMMSDLEPVESIEMKALSNEDEKSENLQKSPSE